MRTRTGELLLLAGSLAVAGCAAALSGVPLPPDVAIVAPAPVVPKDPNGPAAAMEDHKFVIYQMVTRLFGNKAKMDPFIRLNSKSYNITYFRTAIFSK